MNPEQILYYLLLIPGLLVAVTCHEFAHARVALAFGDDTALREGRVTLNPLAHLDPLGTFGMLFAGFGWGKPVPVNIHALRYPRADLFVSAAGPGTNFLLAFLCALPLRVPALLEMLEHFGMLAGAQLFLSSLVGINLRLAFFNLLPIHPLDGSHVLQNLLPLNAAMRFHELNQTYGYILLLGLILSGYILPVSITSLVLGPPISFVESLLLG